MTCLLPLFLKFMNEALSLYEDEERVISVHGYIYPIKKAYLILFS